MATTVKLCGSFHDVTPEVDALLVGSLAVHRPVYQYMRGTPVTISKRGWTVSHIATGFSIGSVLPKTVTTRRAAADWAKAVQAVDPEAWTLADAYPFGGGTLGPQLVARLRMAAEAVARGETAPAATIGNVNVAEFVRHYVATMLWATTDEADDTGGAPMNANYSADDLAPEAQAEIEADCRAFITAAGALIEPDNYIGRASEADSYQMAAHDFFLTRCGHGAGFWDGDWKSDAHSGLEGPLTALAKQAGEVSPYVGDDNQIYHN